MKNLIFILFILPTILFSQSADLSSGYYDFSSQSDATIEKNMEWHIYGDSYSFTETYYIDRVEEKINFASKTNRGQGSYTMWHIANRLADDLVSDANRFDNVDIVFLQFGANDYVKDSALGNVSDAAGAVGIVGGLRYFIEEILTASPSVDIFVATPAYMNAASVSTPNGVGWTFDMLSDTIKEVVGEYNMKIVDWNGLSGINSLNISTYMSVNHPTPAASIRLGDILAKQILLYK